MKVSNRSVIHGRFKCFVGYIAPDKDKRDDVKRLADDVRTCIETHATADGFTILSSPYSGSFAKKTGLRRSLQGYDEVEGQDIDIVFILKDEDQNGESLDCLVNQFESYLYKRWSESEIDQTLSSANIQFKSSKLQFDVVPLIETDKKEIQKLKRMDGTERQSSVKKHNEFIKKRNKLSNEKEGVVKFNECLRLIKWWKCQRQSESSVFGNNKDDESVPSFLLSLLCAYAYDEEDVKETYPETLATWFGFLAHILANRKTVVFDDFIKKHDLPENEFWLVCDPMDDTNNIVSEWEEYEIDELRDWFESARDKINRAIRHDREGKDKKSLDCLVELFGNSISNQCK